MFKGLRGGALIAAMALGLAANAQAAITTFTFRDMPALDDPRPLAHGVLRVDGYADASFSGNFVSWQFYRGSTLVYQLTAADSVTFTSDLAFQGLIEGLDGLGNVRIQSEHSDFETGLLDPDTSALLWNLTLNPVCDPGIPCGGGDGPQVDNSPPITFAWRLEPLTAAVPEPLTWALMIGGFAAVGTQLRTRRRRLA